MKKFILAILLLGTGLACTKTYCVDDDLLHSQLGEYNEDGSNYRQYDGLEGNADIDPEHCGDIDDNLPETEFGYNRITYAMASIAYYDLRDAIGIARSLQARKKNKNYLYYVCYDSNRDGYVVRRTKSRVKVIASLAYEACRAITGSNIAQGTLSALGNLAYYTCLLPLLTAGKIAFNHLAS